MSGVKTILVVDDDPDILKLLKAKFEATGRFAVVVAEDGPAALALAQAQPPDLVLCDIDLPDMNGGEVVAALAAKPATKGVPMIFLSSLITNEEERRGIKSGGWPVVSKETPIADLILRIDVTLGAL
jgi:CheY-like chemotaxis protein